MRTSPTGTRRSGRAAAEAGGDSVAAGLVLPNDVHPSEEGQRCSPTPSRQPSRADGRAGQLYGLVRTARAWRTSKVTGGPSVVVVPGTSAGALPLTVNVAPQVTVR